MPDRTERPRQHDPGHRPDDPGTGEPEAPEEGGIAGEFVDTPENRPGEDRDPD